MARSLCSFLVAFSFAVGAMVFASQQVEVQATAPLSAEYSLPIDCNHGKQDENAPPLMPCPEVFCVGMAWLSQPPQSAREAQYELASVR